MEIKTLDDAGIKLIAYFEGCVLHPYLDNAKIPTIGIGMTYYPETGKRVTMKDKPLESIAEAYRQFTLMSVPKCMSVYSVTRDDLTQNQFNALVSLTYNIGDAGYKGSTVHRLVDQNISGPLLKGAFCMWDKITIDGVHKVDNGLLQRRIKEYEIYTAVV